MIVMENKRKRSKKKKINKHNKNQRMRLYDWKTLSQNLISFLQQTKTIELFPKRFAIYLNK